MNGPHLAQQHQLIEVIKSLLPVDPMVVDEMTRPVYLLGALHGIQWVLGERETLEPKSPLEPV